MNKEIQKKYQKLVAENHYQMLLEMVDVENHHPQILAEFGTGALELTFTVGMHGDEIMPIRAVQNLLPRLQQTKFNRLGRVRFVACNPAAMQAQTRLIDVDLNDVFPGNSESQLAEERLAPEILALVQDSAHVVDLHTGHEAPPFGVLPTRHLAKLKLLEKSGIDKIVVFENEEDAATGPMVDYTHCGIGVEAGPHTSESSITTAESIILQYLHNFGFIDLKDHERVYSHPQYFEIIDQVSLQDGAALAQSHHFAEFQPVRSDIFSTKTEEEYLYPLLINPERDYDDIYMYLTKKLSRPQLVQTL